MKDYFFVLDKEHGKLSILELFSYFETRNITYKLLKYSDKVAVFRLGALDVPDFVLTIGGILKIGEIISRKTDPFQGLKDFNYKLTSYSNSSSEFKKFLESKFKGSKKSQNIIEFLVFDEYLSRKISDIDFKEFKLRGRRKPSRKMKRPIPVSLARVMVNLSKAKEGDILVDPFCGSGTILQEALLNGCEVIGIDLSKTMVKATMKNLKWLYDQYDLKQNFEIIKGDSTYISKYLTLDEVDAIVTEPFIPVFRLVRPSFKKAKEIIRELEKLYYLFLMNARKILKNNGRVCIVVPVIITSDGKKITMDFFKLANQSDFKVVEFLDDFSLPYSYKDKESISKGFIREIYVLE